MQCVKERDNECVLLPIIELIIEIYMKKKNVEIKDVSPISREEMAPMNEEKAPMAPPFDKPRWQQILEEPTPETPIPKPMVEVSPARPIPKRWNVICRYGMEKLERKIGKVVVACVDSHEKKWMELFEWNVKREYSIDCWRALPAGNFK